MHPVLRRFTQQFAGVVMATLVPVMLTAFVSIPLNLGGHPGEARFQASLNSPHTT
ncbi:MAG: hypothetical protein IPP44_23685 [Ideonella sp.]|nr:hypothetical protein [Ideonella sp.]